jgi:hypothetical protein
MPAVGSLVRSTNGMWIARPLRPRWIALAIHNFHNSGNTTTHARSAGCALAAFFDRLGCYEPAAMSRFRVQPAHRSVGP